MVLPVNSLVNVQTYQQSGLAYLQNLCCFISTANTKFKNFQNETAQLGATVRFTKPPRYTTVNSLVAAFEATDMREQSLTIDKEISTSFAFSSQQLLLNVEDYMRDFGKGAIAEIGTKIEADVANLCVTAPYRFFGNGVTPINSYNQLASAISQFRAFGSGSRRLKGYFDVLAEPGIIASGLAQFAPDRNNKDAMSWEVGSFSDTDWYRSNLLPIHTAGTIGINNTLLTVTGITQNASGGVTAISFSGGPVSDASAVLANDKFQFQDGVAGQTNMRYRTFVGHEVTGLPVQFRATATAASDGAGAVTVTIDPPLQAASGKDQNTNVLVAVGMQVRALPSHRAGMICADDALFLAMPQLPDQSPFETGNAVDPDTGVSIRQTYGTLYGQNQQGMIYDAIWGKTLPSEYAMSLIFPL